MSERETIDGRFICVAAALIAIAFFIGVAAGNETTNAWWEKATVSRGLAEYVIKENGLPVWKWRDAQP